MKPYFALGLLVIAAGPFAHNQAAPAATAGGADLRYSLRYSGDSQWGGSLGTWNTINTSGSLDYANGRVNRPFSLGFTGGYAYTLTGPAYSQGVFQVLSVSQGLHWRKWMLQLSDNVGYRPQAPTTGFSGIPGTGEPIGTGTNPPPSQLILTLNTHALNNNASGELEHILSHDLILDGNASHDLIRYPDENGIDTEALTIGAGPTLRLDARNLLTGRYAFSRFSYSGAGIHLITDAALFGYERTWSRSFHSKVSVGPQWIRASALIPSSTNVSAQASLSFQGRSWSASLTYDRGTSGGSGYLMGVESDSATASLSRSFDRTVTLEMTGGYRHSSALATRGDISGAYGGTQASWSLGRYVSAFASYTATSQSSSAQLPSNVLNQLMQMMSFGISFSRDLKSPK